MSIKNKAVTGLFWTFTQQFSVQAINFIVQIILARILLPSEFGLIAMISIFIALGIKFVTSGMTSSLIRTTNPTDKDYSTVFFINLGISIIVLLIIFFTAPLIANFYSQPILNPLIRVYSITFLIRAFVEVQTTRLTKEMKFKIQMKMQIPSVIVGGAVGICMAYLGYGVWSIVWMNIVQTSLFTVQHWIYSKWTPSFKLFDRKVYKYHFTFGYKMMISGIMNTIFENLYNILIGKYFTSQALGFYNRAYMLQMFPVSNLGTALTKVTFPMFSEIKDNDKKLKEAYKKVLQQVVFWIAPLMMIAGVLAKPLFIVLMTEKWLPAVPYFQILCVMGILYPLQIYNLDILKVKGRSDLYLKVEVMKKITTVIGIFIALQYGVLGLVIMQSITSVIYYFYNSYYSGKFMNYDVFEQLRDILPILTLALISALITYLSQHFLFQNSHSIIQLLLGYLIGFGFFLGTAFMLKINTLLLFRDLVIKKFLGKVKLINS